MHQRLLLLLQLHLHSMLHLSISTNCTTVTVDGAVVQLVSLLVNSLSTLTFHFSLASSCLRSCLLPVHCRRCSTVSLFYSFSLLHIIISTRNSRHKHTQRHTQRVLSADQGSTRSFGNDVHLNQDLSSSSSPSTSPPPSSSPLL